jgi:hypothetical protein
MKFLADLLFGDNWKYNVIRKSPERREGREDNKNVAIILCKPCF